MKKIPEWAQFNLKNIDDALFTPFLGAHQKQNFDFQSIAGDRLTIEQTKQLFYLDNLLSAETDRLYNKMGLDMTANYKADQQVESFSKLDNFVLCFCEKEIVGMVRWQLSDYIDCCIITALYVEDKFRNLGVGGSLLDEALFDMNLMHPGKHISIGVVENNHIAKRLYESRGFDMVCHKSLIKKGDSK